MKRLLAAVVTILGLSLPAGLAQVVKQLPTYSSNAYTGSSVKAGAYNPYTGASYQYQRNSNAWTGTQRAHVSGYNPYTGVSANRAAAYNPYLGAAQVRSVRRW